MTKKLIDLVLEPPAPNDPGARGAEGDPRFEHSPANVWLRRVAFLLAAASPALGCSDSGSSDPCVAYAEKMVTCDGYYAGYSQEYVEQICQEYLQYASHYGASCHAAFEDYYACISHLSCAQIENDDYSECTSESNQVSIHCDSY